MKILLSADCFYPAQMGGPSNALYWQAKALTQAGHQVTVVATSYCLPASVPTDQWLMQDCGRVFYTKNPHFYAPVKHIWYAYQAIQRVDVVHINSLFYPASFIWVLLSRWIGRPIVWSPHGELSPAALVFRPRLKRLLLWVIKRFGSSVQFHATSAVEATHIRQHFGANVRIAVIHNRMQLPAPVVPIGIGPPYLLFVGRLHPIKAIDQLLKALAGSAVFRESNYILLIAGPVADKGYVQTLKEQIATLQLSQKVSFVGFVQGTQKEALYANARLTILPSHAENFGNVVMESLAQGTPVVASAHTPWQLLETERIGSWVSNEPAPLQKAVEAYLTMLPAEYQGYRERAIKVAQRQFDSLAGAIEWEHFYEQILVAHERH